ncbi:hypothetical protein KC353_g65 [Hortaea werneckii]|nr:hypothetical protein KC353_g65 [Hortaea werneckii]
MALKSELSWTTTWPSLSNSEAGLSSFTHRISMLLIGSKSKTGMYDLDRQRTSQTCTFAQPQACGTEELFQPLGFVLRFVLVHSETDSVRAYGTSPSPDTRWIRGQGAEDTAIVRLLISRKVPGFIRRKRQRPILQETKRLVRSLCDSHDAMDHLWRSSRWPKDHCRSPETLAYHPIVEVVGADENLRLVNLIRGQVRASNLQRSKRILGVRVGAPSKEWLKSPSWGKPVLVTESNRRS